MASDGHGKGAPGSNPDTFDAYANKYGRTLDEAVRISGDTALDFARYKAELFSAELGDASGLTVLDFGCGVGFSTRALAEAMPRARIVGVDPSRESIAVARKSSGNFANVEFMEQPADRLPFAEGTFDAAFTGCVLHHIERTDHLKWLGEARRVLRSRATFIVFEHNPLNPLTRKVVRDCPYDEGVTLLTPVYLRSTLAGAGLVPRAPRFYYFFPRGLSALRFLEPRLRWLPLGAQYYVRADRQR